MDSSLIEKIEEVAIGALRTTRQIHEELGTCGEETVQKNQFGENSLRMDVEAEKVIIDAFLKARIPIRIKSEEHGTVEIGEEPTCLGVLDGLDGSGVYRKARGKGRYGTMFGIFSNLDPCYDEYLFSGIMEHTTNRLFFSSKGKGSFMVVNGIKRPIKCSGALRLGKQTRIYIDEGVESNKTLFSKRLGGFNTFYLGSSAVYYADMASGNADLVLECTRKGSLEIAVAYGLIRESGGVMVTMDGNDLGGRKYLSFGQDTHIPVVTASTSQLAQDLIDYVNRIESGF
ncbi:MAG: hypothetical protein COX90_02075 [Candidatus Nealsonbacteria bacterium CG_4_10_14_0_2_um_filter_38_17]|uniref:Inositol monophosphatase n=2 Tax=Candidatus Nealsoniibacteriota TaxID=1817911 RepID=A0A2M7UYH4_9BACT|nr:MAG: hypothetical protein COX36_01750 [Candidatus Nealsonbacteria bacterium CG23_combo_of_CG06-09_8_20_14_all_38_19]PIZ88915.1 MAG: hypothetical protein COX90_02075 [Candidatus Nealsonbacteria bacterium CG_4_10_14_0_2_um_filter_38_17]